MLLSLATRYQKASAIIFFELFFFSLIASGSVNYSDDGFKYSLKNYTRNKTADKFFPTVTAKPERKVGNKLQVKPLSQNKSTKLLIGGPGQPEMSGFKPVGSDNMVDPFTGDFSYNIPLLDVGGYPVNIFYNSGITMDQEASWCGLGWNINPGTIMRNMRGLPDDFDGSKGDSIKKTMFTNPEKTYGVSVGGSAEVFGGPIKLAFDAGIFYNNMRGIGLEAGINPTLAIGSCNGDEKTAPLNFGWSLKANSQTGGSQTFSISLTTKNKDAGTGGTFSASLGMNSRSGMQSLHLSAEYAKDFINSTSQRASIVNGDFGIKPTLGTTISFAYPAIIPSIRSRLRNRNVNIDLGFGVAGWGAFPHVRLGGYYTTTFIKPEDITVYQPAYGMLYMQQGNTDKNAMLDFNRLNDGVYTPNAPTVAIPAYTYDVFSISGEGTGGSFRAYRGDLGFTNDPYTENTSESDALGIEVGGGTYGHGAVNTNIVKTPSHAGLWNTGNLAKSSLAFKNSNGDYQSAYFKNPGEKAIPDAAYQNAIGGEDLVRLKMINTNNGGNPTLIPALMRYTDTRQYKGVDAGVSAATAKKRDKRTQVISFLTAEEADKVGLNKKIPSIKIPYDTLQTVVGCAGSDKVDSSKRLDNAAFPYRKAHQISEIDVLSQDGRRYIYGTPVYNTKQLDVTFSKPGNVQAQSSQILNFSPGQDDLETENPSKDGYVEKQEMPAYTHSFLLTGLLSPNYVDVKGDGITDDDMGDAVKFNYSMMPDKIGWRTPIGENTATYNEGLKTDKNDDKSHYIYGERESWYLYNIESKNMVARFYIKNDRLDSKSVDQYGKLQTGIGAQRLDKISLFTKADILKYGSGAKPIKTVHFTYDYSLCPGTAGSINGAGKLTLKSVYFTYNGNNKLRKNYYRFYYPADKNYPYNYTELDRWGNYKPIVANQGGLKNSDFPYVNNNRSLTDNYVASWTMNKIGLPSGSTINVDYEADDYAYVQDRRAADMFEVKGFGNTANPSSAQLSSNQLYIDKNNDNDYIYIKVSKPITASGNAAKDQIREWYLGNILKTRQLFMKLSVRILRDKPGSEMIPIYAEIDGDNYGVVAGSGGYNIYIKVKKLESNYTPMVQMSLQFMKNYLPAQAYPGNDVSESGGLRQVVRALGGLYHSFKENFKKGFALFKEEGKCKTADNALSFVRLTDPNLQKLGGGLRVKKIMVNDNFDKMTRSNPNAADGMINATYGQEYFYNKQELVNGQLQTISSGVASWEPSMGGEENPHREIMSYYNKNKKGPFDYSSVELPLAEMFFPSASVGYSRVEVRSIHRDTVKNAPGIQVTEYFTTREFPTKVSYTPLEDNNATDKYDPSPLIKFLKINVNKAVTLSQGFKADLNDMNGKMRKQSIYASNNLTSPISYTENFYNIQSSGNNIYKFNHDFKVIANSSGQVTTSTIGREVEMMTDFREHKMETFTTNLNFNMDVIAGLFIPIPVPTWFSPTVYESDTYRSSSVLKIVNHYGIIDSIKVVDKGSVVSTKNLFYDAETGDPLVTRTNNEYNFPIYNLVYPAHWAYSGMSPAYKNIDVVYSGVTFRNGHLETSGVDMNLFESGDEIYVRAENGTGPEGVLPCDPNTSALLRNNAKKIWAVNTNKTASAHPEIVFIDAEGNPYTARDVYMHIIRSGKRNMASTPISSVMSLANPITNNVITLNDATNVLKTTAATFKDHWRIDNSYYRKDSSAVNVINGTVKKLEFYNTDYLNLYASRDGSGGFGYNLSRSDFLHLRKDSKSPGKGNRSHEYINQSFLLFDLNNSTYGTLPPNAKMYRAYLSINSHVNKTWGVTSVSANHPHNHGPSASQMTGHLAQVNLLKNQWFPINGTLAAANLWGTNYLLNTPVISGNTALIPSSNTGEEDYTYGFNGTSFTDARINVSSLLQENIGTPLGDQRKAGFRLKLYNDVAIGGPPVTDNFFRCFWSKLFTGAKYMPFSPTLTYYYYVCGDTSMSYTNDPIMDVKIPCYSQTVYYSLCQSKFSKKSINPYLEGVWGNWRVDTTFTYYSNRKDSVSTDNNIDLRTSGTIANFKPFWSLNSATLQRNSGGNAVWAWTSAITQYNRKGYDIENKDPLGRYNAGLYGYNQQLPVAVVNNSHNAESMFDGFEDYNYQNNSCSEFCPPKRRVDFGNASMFIDSTQHHTGKNSLRVTPYSSVNITVPVVTNQSLEGGYSMRVRKDSVPNQITTTMISTGTGLRASYKNFGNLAPSPLIANAPYNFTNNNGTALVLNPGAFSPVPGIINVDWWAVKMEGKIQPMITGNYRFRIAGTGRVRITLNGSVITPITYWDWNPLFFTNPLFSGFSSYVSLQAGTIYNIQAEFYDKRGNSNLNVLWQVNSGLFVPVPVNQLYRPDQTGGIYHNDTSWCTKLDSVQVRGNALTDTFSIVQNKKMFISAWVKESGVDCKTCPYLNNTIEITYNSGYPAGPTAMRPTGAVIEGWQRYEGEFTVPNNVNTVKVYFKNNSASNPVWFDDIRIHPYDANMKSFVYHPSTLKLMAELDENNYAGFYEYDDDGTLVRIKKETIRGIKTITETRSSLQKSIDE